MDPSFAVPADRVRPPSTVSTASYLLYGVAAVSVVSLVVAFATLSSVRGVYNDAFEGTEAAGTGDTVALIAALVVAVPTLIVAIGLVVLAFLNQRGKSAARIVTWVLGGVYVLCCGGLTLFSLAGSAATDFGGTSDPNLPDQAEIQRQVEAALPSWYQPVNIILTVLPILLVLGALVLLAMPASNAYFAQVKAGGVQGPDYPITPGSSYPSYPYPQGEPPLPPPPGSTPPQPPQPPR